MILGVADLNKLVILSNEKYSIKLVILKVLLRFWILWVTVLESPSRIIS